MPAPLPPGRTGKISPTSPLRPRGIATPSSAKPNGVQPGATSERGFTASTPRLAPTTPRHITTGPLGPNPIASQSSDAASRGVVDTRIVAGGLSLAADGVFVRLIDRNGHTVMAQVMPTGQRMALPLAPTLSTFTTPSAEPSSATIDYARLAQRWIRFLGRALIAHSLERVAFELPAERRLPLRVTFDAQTGKPRTAHESAQITRSAQRLATASQGREASVLVQLDVAGTYPSVHTIEASAPTLWQGFFTSLTGQPLQLPTANALREAGLTNALMALNLSVEPPIADGRHDPRGGAPRLVVSVSPEQALITGFRWLWPNGHQRIAGAPWIGVPISLRHTLVTNHGQIARRLLPLTEQPFGDVDPRALAILAAEYLARRRERARGYGSTDDIAEIAWTGETL